MGISLWTMISAIVSVPMSNTNLEIRVGSCTIKKKNLYKKKEKIQNSNYVNLQLLCQ